MNDISPTRRTDEPPARGGVPLAGWPIAIIVDEAVALRGALVQLQTALDSVVRERDEARAEVERLHRAHQAACEGGDLLRAALLAEVERMRAEKEALYASIVGIERAAAGAIYSQESIHAMALYALKSLEVKP
jgi:hypothetical protein